MDDLSATLSQFLSDPDNMRQIQEAAASLGLTGQGSSSSGSRTSSNNSGGSQTNSGWSTGSVGRNTKRGQGAPNPPPQKPAPSRDADLVAIRSMLEQLLHQQKMQASPPKTAAPSPDLSGLSSLLGNLGGESKGLNGSGLNLSALSDILGNRSAPAQSSQDLSALLGGLGNSSAPSQSGGSGLDLSGLSGLLGNLGSNSNGGLDLSGLSGILGNLSGKSEPETTPSSVSTLTSMLGGDNQPAGSLGGFGGGLDLGMISRFQEAMSSMNTSAGNVRLLLALKGHLRDQDRVAKVDDAIRVMQVVQFLPLLKESGLFGKLEEILDGFNLGGIGDMLGGLTGRR